MGAEPDLTWGFCVDCTTYAQGQPAGEINDRAEAIIGHRDCPGRGKSDTEHPRTWHSARTGTSR